MRIILASLERPSSDSVLKHGLQDVAAAHDAPVAATRLNLMCTHARMRRVQNFM